MIRFKIDSYRNDLPEPFRLMSSPPRSILFAASNITEAEGLDFSNYTEPGKYFVLFPGEDGIEGKRDLMLIGTRWFFQSVGETGDEDCCCE